MQTEQSSNFTTLETQNKYLPLHICSPCNYKLILQRDMWIHHHTLSPSPGSGSVEPPVFLLSDNCCLQCQQFSFEKLKLTFALKPLSVPSIHHYAHCLYFARNYSCILVSVYFYQGGTTGSISSSGRIFVQTSTAH